MNKNNATLASVSASGATASVVGMYCMKHGVNEYAASLLATMSGFVAYKVTYKLSHTPKKKKRKKRN